MCFLQVDVPLSCHFTAAGLLEAALSDYSRVLACEAGHVEAAYQRGSVAHKLGRLEQAIADFSRVLQLDPNHVKAAYSRAAANNQAGRFDDANGGEMVGCAAAAAAACFSDWRMKAMPVACAGHPSLTLPPKIAMPCCSRL